MALAIVFVIALVVFIYAAYWKTFVKAGREGWEAIIPVYNMYVLCKIADRPGWWLVLMFIPLVNLVIIIIVSIDIANNFGKSTGFGLGLAFLSFIFFPILGFGDAVYKGGGQIDELDHLVE